MYRRYSPPRSENQASDFPSGDHAGERSFDAGVAVRLRSSPFSRGTVKMSPRNSKAARAPDGEMAVLRMYFLPLTKRGKVSTRSAATPTFTRLLVPLFGSSR